MHHARRMQKTMKRTANANPHSAPPRGVSLGHGVLWGEHTHKQTQSWNWTLRQPAGPWPIYAIPRELENRAATQGGKSSRPCVGNSHSWTSKPGLCCTQSCLRNDALAVVQKPQTIKLKGNRSVEARYKLPLFGTIMTNTKRKPVKGSWIDVSLLFLRFRFTVTWFCCSWTCASWDRTTQQAHVQSNVAHPRGQKEEGDLTEFQDKAQPPRHDTSHSLPSVTSQRSQHLH